MSVKLRIKTLASKKKSYYLDIYHEGERSYEFLKIYIETGDKNAKEKKQLAESIRATRELELQHQSYGFIPSHRRKIDFFKYYQNYLDKYQGKDHRKIRYSLEKLKLMVNKPTLPASQVTPKLCEEYKAFLLNPANGLRGETPYTYWSKFKRILKEARKDGIFHNNPAEGISISVQPGQMKKNVLTSEELQMMASTPCGNEEIKRAFLFACFTGLGMAEIRQLTWKKIQNDKMILFREKSGEQIINDLHPVALKIIGEPQHLEALIFTLPSDVSIAKTLKRWVAKAGIEKHISFYCGRHTFATNLLKNGANLKTVADCLGHSSTKHTLKYLNYVDALKSDAIHNLPNLEF